MVPPSIHIRPVRENEEALVGELLVRSFNQTYAVKMPEVIMTERRRAELLAVPSLQRRGARVLVAERDGQVVGTVSLFPPDYPGGHSFIPGTAELRFLAIEPALQGAGLAEPLLAECVRVARDEWRCAGISLHTRRGAHGVARFYTKRGFVRFPEGDVDDLPERYLEAHLLAFVPPSLA